MEDINDTLTKFSFIIFVLSLSILVFLFYLYSPEEILLSNLNTLTSNDYFKFRGEIISVKDYDKVAYFTVGEMCTVDLMIFKEDNFSFKNISGKIIGEGHVLDKDVYILDSFKIN